MSNPNVEPLAQSHSIALQVPDAEQYFFHDPGMTRMDDGTLIVAAPQWQFMRFGGRQSTRVARSADGGRTWEELAELPYADAAPFLVDGSLFMFVQEKSHHDFQIVTSEDRGLTWSAPMTVLEAPVWNISTPMLKRPEALYWAMDYSPEGRRCHGKVMARLESGKPPMEPESWSLSNVVPEPSLPDSMTRKLYSATWDSEHRPRSPLWLEPNTVEVAGCIRVFTRCVIDRYASAHVAAVLDYDPEKHVLSFTQFASWPGGQCKFFVVHDRPSRTYWMLSNLVTNSQDLLGWGDRWPKSQHGPSGNERRWLFLHYSIDCLNWFPAGCVARWPESVAKSFMYPSAVVDGEDLVVMSRTSRDSGDQHNADLVTIHRIRKFRDLAMDLHGGAPV